MYLPLLILLPLFAALLCSLFPNRSEKAISHIAVASTVAVILTFAWTLAVWIGEGFAPLSQAGLTLFSSDAYVFALHFYMDAVSAVFFGITCLITLLVLLFSKYYMHRDPGFRRFHSTILFFFFGLALVIFSGNFETLFVGWEFIGISSFLLISFYRDRFLPTKNGLKVFALYRIADAFFIVALWYAHHLFEKNVLFSEFAPLVAEHGNEILILGVFFVIVAMIKSAQFPFSYWLPRAMEGPTTSSAIFYGALSVHIGLFLLLRTSPLWEGSTALRVLIGAIGLLTALIAASITRVQSSAKTQIAYSSITQIGIMFIELAAGLHTLALFHFVSNACLRTYQLLISPSILSYLIHYQFYTFTPPTHNINDTLLGRIRASLFMLGIKEWNMDSAMTHHVWQPLKSAGQRLRFLDTKPAMLFFMASLVLGALITYGMRAPHVIADGVIWANAALSILLFARAYANTGAAIVCWTQIFFGQMFAGVFLIASAGAALETALLYLTGIVFAYVAGILFLRYLDTGTGQLSLMGYHGYMYKHPALGNAFFLASLAMMVFPITPSFIGEEVLLGAIHTDHGVLVAIFALGYVLSGVSAMRLFAKVFFGPHEKTYHEIAYRSS